MADTLLAPGYVRCQGGCYVATWLEARFEPAGGGQIALTVEDTRGRGDKPVARGSVSLDRFAAFVAELRAAKAAAAPPEMQPFATGTFRVWGSLPLAAGDLTLDALVLDPFTTGALAQGGLERLAAEVLASPATRREPFTRGGYLSPGTALVLGPYVPPTPYIPPTPSAPSTPPLWTVVLACVALAGVVVVLALMLLRARSLEPEPTPDPAASLAPAE